MNQKQFTEYVIENLEKTMDRKYLIKVEPILKNNGVVLTGINVREVDNNMSAVVYVEPLYKAYKNGSSIIQIVNKIKAQVEHGLVERRFDSVMFQNWEQAKERIVFQLVNYDKNKELLKSIPHKQYFDLAVIFRYYIGLKDEKMVTSIIQNPVFEEWGITEDELFETALQNNIRLLPASRGRLDQVLFGWDAAEAKYEQEDNMVPSIYILSNTYGINGAAVLLYPEEIEKMSELLQKDLIILPSSVHEILVVEHDGSIELSSYLNMVRSVNQESVPEEDILSDNIYVYRKETKTLEFVENSFTE